MKLTTDLLHRFLKAVDRASRRNREGDDEGASKLREFAIKLVSENFEILNNGDVGVETLING